MQEFTIENDQLKAVFLNYGAILHQLWVKDKKGLPTNVIMGLNKPKDYLKDTCSRGAVIGRYAGRLENPIEIHSKAVTIENNEGILLHSGSSGWAKQLWKVKEQKINKITFQYTCPEGASGFPGRIEAQISYKLENEGLYLDYDANTDKDTHINLTNHAYFNLNPKGRIKDQLLCVSAEEILELNTSLVPTGMKKTVNNTRFDFRTKKQINEIRLDDYFVLDDKSEEAAILFSPDTGIEMTTYTNQPGIVIFTSADFDAICFETQKFPNTPNIESFPSTLIKAGERYQHKTHFKFRTKT